jgi:hypothetical protein
MWKRGGNSVVKRGAGKVQFFKGTFESKFKIKGAVYSLYRLFKWPSDASASSIWPKHARPFSCMGGTVI